MDAQFFCRECGADHIDPADARLGHRVICRDCEFALEIATASTVAAATETIPLAA